MKKNLFTSRLSWAAFVAVGLFMSLQPAQAGGGGGGGFHLEPVVTWERSYSNYPTSHASNAIGYGIRALGGKPELSGELEVVMRNSKDVYALESRTLEQDAIRYRIGVRSEKGNGPASAFVRAGVQATTSTFTETTSGVSTEYKDDVVRVYPYLGFGFNLKLGNAMKLTLSATSSIHDWVHLRRNGYDGAVGLQFGFGK